MPDTKTQVPVPRLHQVKDAAETLSVSKNTVWRMMRDGELEWIRVRNRRRITNLESYIELLKQTRKRR